MANLQQIVRRVTYETRSDGVAETRKEVEGLGRAHDGLGASLDKSRSRSDEAIRAMDRLRQSMALQTQATEAQTRALQQANQAHNDNIRVANDNTSAMSRLGSAIADHPVRSLVELGVGLKAASVGLGVVSAGLGTASVATAALAAENGFLAGAYAVVARGLAAGATAVAATAGGAAALARQLSITTLVMRGVGAVAGVAIPYIGAFGVALGAIKFAADGIEKVANDYAKLVEIGAKAEKLDVSAGMIKSFEKLGDVVHATSAEMDAALAHAAVFLKDQFNQQNQLSALFDKLQAGGFTAGGPLAAQMQLGSATTNEEKIKAAVAGMKELDQIGQRFAALDIAEKVFGAALADKMRAANVSATEFAQKLDEAGRTQIIAEGQEAKALAVSRAIEQTRKEIAEAWKWAIDFGEAGTNAASLWNGVLGIVAGISKWMNSASVDATSFATTIGNASIWTKINDGFAKWNLMNGKEGLEASLNKVAGIPDAVAKPTSRAGTEMFGPTVPQAYLDNLKFATKATDDLAAASKAAALGGMEPLARDTAQANARFEERGKVLDEMRSRGIDEAKITQYQAQSQATLAKELANANAAEAKRNQSNDNSLDAVDQYLIRQQKAVDLAKAEFETILSTNRAREEAKALAEAKAAAERDYERKLRDTADLTDPEVAKIRAAADATADWKEKAKQLNDALSTAFGAGNTFFSTFASSLVEGKNAMESMAAAGKSLASSLASKGFQSLFSKDTLSAIKDGNYGQGIAAGGQAIGGTLMGIGLQRGSTLLSVGGGALAGAATGFMVGGPVGAAVGGVAGGAIGLVSSIFSQQQAREQRLQTLAQAQADQMARWQQIITDAVQRQNAFADTAFGLQQDTQTKIGALAVFERSAQRAREAEAKAGGYAMVQLETQISAQREAIEKDFADRLAARQLGYQDRLFNALHANDNTLEGKLLAFDIEANREREAEKKSGNEAIADLEAALASERLNVITDFNKAAIENEKAAAEQRLQAINGAAKSVVDYVNGLVSGPQSTESPQSRYNNALAVYNSQLALAKTGNVDAQAGITGYAENLRTAARDIFASSTNYQNVLSTIKTDLLALPAVQQTTDPVVQALRDVLTAVNVVGANTAGLLTETQLRTLGLSKDTTSLTLLTKSQMTTLGLATDGTVGTLLTKNQMDLLGLAKDGTVLTKGQMDLLDLAKNSNILTKGQMDLLDLAKNGTVLTDGQVRALGLATDNNVLTKAQMDLLGLAKDANLLTKGQMDLLDLAKNGTVLTEAQIRGLGLATDNSVGFLLTNTQMQNLGLATDGTVGTLLTSGQLSILGLAKDATTGAITTAVSAGLGDQGSIRSVLNLGLGDQAPIKAAVEADKTATDTVAGRIGGSDSEGIRQLLAIIKDANTNRIAAGSAFNLNSNSYLTAEVNSNAVTALNKIVWNTAIIAYNTSLAYDAQGARLAGNHNVQLATGGWVNGPGTGTSDSIAAMLSNGEFVVKADAAASLRPYMEDIGRGRLPVLPVPYGGANDNGNWGAVLAELRELRAIVAAGANGTIRAVDKSGERVEGAIAEGMDSLATETRQASRRAKVA